MVLPASKLDTKFCRGDAVALGFFHPKARAETQALQPRFDGLPIGAGIHQRAYSHVAADARKRVEIADFHADNKKRRPSRDPYSLAVWQQNPRIRLTGLLARPRKNRRL